MSGKEVRLLLSKNLKVFRKRRGWSQADLAENAGISVTFLSSIERGNKWPYPDTLSNLAFALDVDVDQLFKEDEPMNSDTDKSELARLLKDASFSIEKTFSLSLKQTMDRLRQQYLPEVGDI
jgi:transcriptional regulator with XRE-family HTH domain